MITLLGLISVCLGLDAGIKRLSQANMVIALILVFSVLLIGPTVFILNAMIQNAGVYINEVIRLSTWTEAYNNSIYRMVIPCSILLGGLLGHLLFHYLLQEFTRKNY